MSLFRYRDSKGQVHEVLAFKGNKGDTYNLTEQDKKDIANMAKPPIDQTYTPESTNAQSGIAVAEAVSGKADKWTTLIDFTVTEEQSGISEIKYEIPNLELLKNASRMKIRVNIKAQEEITAQGLHIYIQDVNRNSYYLALCHTQGQGCNAGETLTYVGMVDFFSPVGTQKHCIVYFMSPTKYEGVNSNGNMSKMNDVLNFDLWKSLPPILYIKLASGGIIGAGSKIIMEVC